MKIQELVEAEYKYGRHKTEKRNRVTVIMDLESMPERYEININRYPNYSPYQNAMEGLANDIDAAGRQAGINMPDQISYSGSAAFPEGKFKYNSNAIRDVIRTVVKGTPGFSLKY